MCKGRLLRVGHRLFCSITCNVDMNEDGHTIPTQIKISGGSRRGGATGATALLLLHKFFILFTGNGKVCFQQPPMYTIIYILSYPFPNPGSTTEDVEFTCFLYVAESAFASIMHIRMM